MFSIEIENLVKTYPVASWLEHPGSTYSYQWLVTLIKMLKGVRGKRIVALDNVNFKVKRGELFGIVGPNGAGKTTLFKCISGVLIPDSGEIYVEGIDAIRRQEEVKNLISVIGAGSYVPLDWTLNARESLEFFLTIYGLNPRNYRKEIKEVLELVGLKGREEDNPETYSSGMRQKILIAAGLLLDRPIFLMDEPTMGIDPLSAYEIRLYIKNVLNKKYRRTILLASHYMNEIEMLCDRVMILYKGKVIEINSIEEFKRKIQVKRKIELTCKGELKILKKILDENNLPNYTISEISERITVEITTNNPEGVLIALIDRIRENNLRLLKAEIKEPSFEEIFARVITGEN